MIETFASLRESTLARAGVLIGGAALVVEALAGCGAADNPQTVKTETVQPTSTTAAGERVPTPPTPESSATSQAGGNVGKAVLTFDALGGGDPVIFVYDKYPGPDSKREQDAKFLYYDGETAGVICKVEPARTVSSDTSVGEHPKQTSTFYGIYGTPHNEGKYRYNGPARYNYATATYARDLAPDVKQALPNCPVNGDASKLADFKPSN